MSFFECQIKSWLSHLQGQNSVHHSEGTRFHNRREVSQSSFLFSSVLSGTSIARLALWNWLNAQYSNLRLNNHHHPIIGTVHVAGTGLINITHLGRLSAAEYRLFGMGPGGTRFFIWIPNTGTNMTLMNRGNNTGIDGGTSAGNFASITVDLAKV